MTRSANRHAEHVIAVLTWPLEDSGNPERGFFSSESPVRKPTPRSAKTILLMTRIQFCGPSTNMPKY